MKIAYQKTLPKGSTPVFLIKDEDKIERHPFYKTLEKPDREYLVKFQKNFPVKKEHNHPLVLPGGLKVLLIGLGEKTKFSHRKAILAARRVIVVAKKEKVKNLAVYLDDFLAKENKDNQKTLAEVLATQMELANFEFVKYKTPEPNGWFFAQEVNFLSQKPNPSFVEAVTTGQIIGEEINNARNLSNTPGSDMTPRVLAKEAEDLGKKWGVKVQVLEEKEIEMLGMGGVLGVARGSSERPKFIIMEYLKGKRGEKPVVLVGKGVTFDTGGLNIKPDDYMYEMHMDMSGGSVAIHSIAAMARLKIKKNIVALVPAVENMPSGSSYHPGDVLKTMSGKTIEVLNTDAEGRVILADALEYAKKYKPRLVIDIATLTGSAMSALGQRASAVFSNNARAEQKIIESGELAGDYAWALPLWEEYEEEIKGTFGDVANSGKTRYGGVITAAVFLWQFIKSDPSTNSPQIPWVHIDMAPRMTPTETEFLAKGSTGAPVGLLAQFLRKF